MPYVNLPSDGLPIYYEEYGAEHKEFPTIVVCHGGPGLSDHRLYRRFWSDFPASGNHVVLFDMRGHGLSEDGDPSKWTLAQWAEDLYQFCETLKIKNPIIASVSFGGWVSLAYATNPAYRDQASGLILCNTEAKLDFEAQAEAYKARALKLGKSETEASNIAQIVFLNNTAPSVEIAAKYREHCVPIRSITLFSPEELASTRKNLALYKQFYSGEHSFDFSEKLGDIRIPTLVLGGEEDPEHPIAGVSALASGIPRASFRALAGAAAPVYLDKPEETLGAILEFRAPLKICEPGADCSPV
jgi:pimeloyl-ACP methyl ester carboxylesterase